MGTYFSQDGNEKELPGQFLMAVQHLLDNCFIFTTIGHAKMLSFLFIKTRIERANEMSTQRKLNVNRIYLISTRKNTSCIALLQESGCSDSYFGKAYKLNRTQICEKD